MRTRTLAATTLAGIAVLALWVAPGGSRASAQVRPITPPPSAPTVDPSDQTGQLLPPGVESNDQAVKRVTNYKPDPVKYPVPRTPWDGKPDFSGVYWPSVNITRAPVALESLYRTDADVRAYREGGGAARGLIDWRSIDSPAYHCWPASPVSGSMALTVQLASAPGYLLMLNEGGGNYRIIPIVSDNSVRTARTPAKPSFLGSSVAHWEGDTLVVEVTRFNGRPWLGPARPPMQLPQTSSDELRIVERWSRPDGNSLDFQAVVEDPKMLTAPWKGPVQRRGMLPYDTIQEALCFEEADLYARNLEWAQTDAARKKQAP
jgi:hypothetical protein